VTKQFLFAQVPLKVILCWKLMLIKEELQNKQFQFEEAAD